MNDKFTYEDVFNDDANNLYFHKYKIFKDLSRKEFVNGKELEEIISDPSLDDQEREERMGRWLFFNRPWFSRLPQKRLIKEQNKEILRLAQSTKFIRNKNIFQQALVFGVSALMINTVAIPVILPVLAFSGGAGLFFYNYRATKDNGQAILQHKQVLQMLTEQIDRITNQAKIQYKRSDMDAYWRYEKKSIKKAILQYGRFNKQLGVDDEDESYFLDSWGIHQPKEIFTDNILNDTGLTDAITTLGKNCLTWRNGRGYTEPLYRLMYCQILILKEGGIISGRVFFDLVTKQKFGQKAEYIRNNHISNIKVQEIPIPDNEELRALSHKKFHPIIFVKRAKSISLPVSSGSIFNCMIADSKGLSRAFNDWLEFLRVDGKHQQMQENPERTSEDLHQTSVDIDKTMKEQEDELDQIVNSLYLKLEGAVESQGYNVN